MKFCIIGLGIFGKKIAEKLFQHGAEVLAIDSDEHEIAAIQNNVTQAMCTEIIDIPSLEAIGIDNIDVVVIAIGENIAQSILIAAIIKKRFGHIKVIARAASQTQKEILELLKVDQVVLPEEETAAELADILNSPFTNLARLSNTFSIGLINIADHFVGKKIQDIDLYKKYKISCIAVQRETEFISINSNYVILDYDKLVVSGKDNDIIAFEKDNR
ncbi:TrkA family potassium uptake protein [Candidatus Dependentiae bacterium]|nr:TrkA family potassium uptake protein [Candidatus Dependentiae bacterium]